MTKDELRTRLFGYWHGYPICCVEWFAQHTDQPSMLWSAYARLTTTYGFPSGFIPCPNCVSRMTHRMHHTIDPICSPADSAYLRGLASKLAK